MAKPYTVRGAGLPDQLRLFTETWERAADCFLGETIAYKMAAAEVMFDALREIEAGLRSAGHSTATPEQCGGGTCHYCSIRRKVWAAVAAAMPPLPV
jgi:hypothetical protein